VFGIELDAHPPPRWLQVVLLAVFGVGFPVLVASFRLDITVDEAALRFAVRPFLRRTVPRDAIERAESVDYRPLREYLGWGIKTRSIAGQEIAVTSRAAPPL